jgi:hypothetical protein
MSASTIEHSTNFVRDAGKDKSSNMARPTGKSTIAKSKWASCRLVRVDSWQIFSSDIHEQYVSKYVRCFRQGSAALEGVQGQDPLGHRCRCCRCSRLDKPPSTPPGVSANLQYRSSFVNFVQPRRTPD